MRPTFGSKVRWIVMVALLSCGGSTSTQPSMDLPRAVATTPVTPRRPTVPGFEGQYVLDNNATFETQDTTNVEPDQLSAMRSVFEQLVFELDLAADGVATMRSMRDGELVKADRGAWRQDGARAIVTSGNDVDIRCTLRDTKLTCFDHGKLKLALAFVFERRQSVR
jgi:hypothetical protein